LLKNAQTWRVSPRWEPANGIGAASRFMVHSSLEDSCKRRVKIMHRPICDVHRQLCMGRYLRLMDSSPCLWRNRICAFESERKTCGGIGGDMKTNNRVNNTTHELSADSR